MNGVTESNVDDRFAILETVSRIKLRDKETHMQAARLQVRSLAPRVRLGIVSQSAT